MKLTRNAVRCKTCLTVISSRSCHDFVRCPCGNVSVDGGLDYAKRSFPSWPPTDWYDELSEYEDGGAAIPCLN